MSQTLRPTSLHLALIAAVLAHGALFLLERTAEYVDNSPKLAPIQLTTFRTDVPFIPGTPAAAPAKPKPAPKKMVNSFAATTETKTAPKQDTVTTQESAIDSSPATGQGGVASSFNSAGTMATGDLRAIYLSELRAKLEEVKHYPLQARRLGQTGSVEVSFVVHADGKIVDAKILRPSPFKRLNESALATVEGLKKFRPLPDSMGRDPLTVTLPIRYSIRN